MRQTPLWDRLWSIFSSGPRLDSTQKVLLVPMVETEWIFPRDSIIPVNIGDKDRLFGGNLIFRVKGRELGIW